MKSGTGLDELVFVDAPAPLRSAAIRCRSRAGAFHVPVTQFETAIKSLPRKGTLITYCTLKPRKDQRPGGAGIAGTRLRGCAPLARRVQGLAIGWHASRASAARQNRL